ncbi:MAG: hypothetical protein FD170_3456 [Bacteroidetes bacterium]|nr:MAG: hypothetical protein FD170_3456 [Bacteroidota bacterium]
MKTLILILHFAFLIFHFSFGQQYGWQNISANLPDFPYDTTIINNGEDTIVANFQGMCFINDNEGWISTYHPWYDSAAILHTTDGGGSWEVQMVEYPVVAIEMLSATEGYAAANLGMIYHTSNGGDTWEFHGSTFALSLADMDFPPGSDTGYVCGQNGAVFRITPEGIEEMFLGTISNKDAIHFISPNQGWVCGESVLQEYKNGEWLAGHAYPSGFWHNIFFVDSLHGWGTGYWLTGAGTTTDTTFVVHTTNDSSWMPQLSNIGNHPLYGIFFLDLSRGWVTGARGDIFSTIDGGQRWLREAEGMTNEWLSGVQFTCSNNGYICGNKMTLLKYGQINGLEEYGGPGSAEVYPNPTSSQFKIQLGKGKVEFKSIELVDIYGKLLEIRNAETSEHDISHLPAGIYFVRVYFDNQMIVKKIVKL